MFNNHRSLRPFTSRSLQPTIPLHNSCLFMRSYQALEDANNANSANNGKRRRFAGASVFSKLSAVIDGMVRFGGSRRLDL